MNLIEKLETRYEAQIVFPDELAREAATEIKRLREALEAIRLNANINGREVYSQVTEITFKIIDEIAKQALKERDDE